MYVSISRTLERTRLQPKLATGSSSSSSSSSRPFVLPRLSVHSDPKPNLKFPCRGYRSFHHSTTAAAVIPSPYKQSFHARVPKGFRAKGFLFLYASPAIRNGDSTKEAPPKLVAAHPLGFLRSLKGSRTRGKTAGGSKARGATRWCQLRQS